MKKLISILVSLIFLISIGIGIYLLLNRDAGGLLLSGGADESVAPDLLGGDERRLYDLAIYGDVDMMFEDENVCLIEECFYEAIAIYFACWDARVDGEDDIFFDVPDDMADLPCDMDSCPFCDELFLSILDDTVCRIPCEVEEYVWDGSPITDLGEFYQMAFPLSYEESKEECLSGGELSLWIETADQIGCYDFSWGDFVRCDSIKLISMSEICEELGGDWLCAPRAPISQILCTI